MSSKQVIKNGTRAVVINEKGGAVFANLYVNAGSGVEQATITGLRFTGKTVAGAVRWANRQLAA